MYIKQINHSDLDDKISSNILAVHNDIFEVDLTPHFPTHVNQLVGYKNPIWILAYSPFDELIGISTISSYDDSYFLYNVGVIPKYRKKGFATDMVYHAILLNNNIYLRVRKDNENAINLYKKLNFELVENSPHWIDLEFDTCSCYMYNPY